MVIPKEQNEVKRDAFKIHISVLDEKMGVRGVHTIISSSAQCPIRGCTLRTVPLAVPPHENPALNCTSLGPVVNPQNMVNLSSR